MTAVPVFIAFADTAAARDAMGRVQHWLDEQRNNLQLEPMLWRLDQLEHSRWREMALHEAKRARLLVIAMNTTAACDTVAPWLEALAKQYSGTPFTALVLDGENDVWTMSLQTVAASESQPQRTSHVVPTAPTTNADKAYPEVRAKSPVPRAA